MVRNWLLCRHFTSSQTLRGPLDFPSVIKTTSMQLDWNSPHFWMLISSLHAHLTASPEWVAPLPSLRYTVFVIACPAAIRPARVFSKQLKQNSNHLLLLNVISANCTDLQKKGARLLKAAVILWKVCLPILPEVSRTKRTERFTLLSLQKSICRRWRNWWLGIHFSFIDLLPIYTCTEK